MTPHEETVTLEEFEFGVQQLLSKHFATKARINKEMDASLERMIEYNFVQSVLGKKLERIEAKYPRDWKEAFKEKWFPRWMKARWPVVYNTLTLRADVFYPMIPLPMEQHHLKLSIMDYYDVAQKKEVPEKPEWMSSAEWEVTKKEAGW